MQEKQKLGALEQELQAARARINDGEAQLNHLKSCAPRLPVNVVFGYELEFLHSKLSSSDCWGLSSLWRVACLSVEGQDSAG